MTTQFSLRKLFKTLLLPFLTYLCLFVGMGYVAGSIVHFGEVSQIPRFAVIGTIGMAMYAIGSYVQEAILNPDNLRREGLVQYILYSLILAVGIGMLSGGTQHFLDFPIYASYLLPSGFLIALVGYVLRNNLNLTPKGGLLLLGGALTLTLPFFLGLHLYAQNLPSSGGHSHGAASPSPLFQPLPQEVTPSSPHGHSQVLKTG